MSSHPLLWEAAQVSGLCAVALCLILCVLAVRPRGGAAASFPLRIHEPLGWVALGAALLHVGLLLAVDRQALEHIKWTAPRYEYAGILALLALLFLTAPAGAAIRPRLWAQHRGFQAAHVAASCLLVITLAMHVLTTDRYIHGRVQAAVYTLLSAAVLLALLRPRSRRTRADDRPARTRFTRVLGRFTDSLVFGRYSRLVAMIILCSLVALAGLLPSRSAQALREPFLRRSQPLPLHFPHPKHWAVDCLKCHHNYADTTGTDKCISCHRSARADLPEGIEAQFHELCFGCHRDPPALASGHGPVTGCDSCHTRPFPSDALPLSN